ncbi:MAG: sulfatase [Ignavibacteriae bacterium]|nr:sulfatase [Ignavibacteriota bacterium]
MSRYCGRVVLILLSVGSMAFAQQRQPNIIVIMTDDHAKKATSLYDGSLNATPNIDRIGAEGVTFRNAFVTNSICGPSRAVFLTGVYSHINGMYDHSRRFDSSQVTLPKILRGNGYFTAIVGKWHLVTTPTGFDYWKVLIDQGEYYNPNFIEMGDTSRYEGYATDIITDLAIETIEKRVGDKPFFLMVNEKAPHRNWMPDTTHLRMYDDREMPMPENFSDDYSDRTRAATEQDMEVRNMYLSSDMKLYMPENEPETGTGGKATFNAKADWKRLYERMNIAQKKAWDEYYKPISDAFYKERPEGTKLAEWKYQRYIKDYLRCIASVDENVGRLLAYLEKKNLLDNTLIVYTSDQGFFLGEHGWYDKRFMYEESIGIPLVMRLPSMISRGTDRSELVLNLDLAPTILQVAGVATPQRMQGSSLVPLFKSGDVPEWRSAVYYHYYEYPHGWHNVKRHYGIRTDRYKLIHFYNDNDEWELFDLKSDPFEMHNLYGKPERQTLVSSLNREMISLMQKYKDTTVVQP